MPFTSEDEDTDAEESNAQQGELIGKDYCTAKYALYTTCYFFQHCMHIIVIVFIIVLRLRGSSAPDKQAVDSIAPANKRDSRAQGNVHREHSNIGN